MTKLFHAYTWSDHHISQDLALKLPISTSEMKLETTNIKFELVPVWQRIN